MMKVPHLVGDVMAAYFRTSSSLRPGGVPSVGCDPYKDTSTLSSHPHLVSHTRHKQPLLADHKQTK